jgi:ribonuclease BN (tRNA processing enzyme)
MLRFEQSGAKIEDLEAVLLTHLHIDHVVDLPSYIKAGYFSKRNWVLTVIGPDENRYFPSTTEYLENLFGSNGAYRYMQDVLTPQSDSFELKGINITQDEITRYRFNSFEVDIIKVYHGIVPALAFKINVDGKSILFSGDTSNKKGMLNKLAKGVELFVADHAVPEHTGKFAKDLHMTPSVIANVAHKGAVKKLLLSHRMNRSLGKEEESLKIISNIYKGSILFAEDRMRITLE